MCGHADPRGLSEGVEVRIMLVHVHALRQADPMCLARPRRYESPAREDMARGAVKGLNPGYRDGGCCRKELLLMV